MGADADIGVGVGVAVTERIQQGDAAEQQTANDNGVADRLPATVVRAVGVAVGVGVRQV